MPRLLIFVFFLVFLSAILSLNGLKVIKNNPLNVKLVDLEKKFHDEQGGHEELVHFEPVIVKVDQVELKLTSESEVKGHELYYGKGACNTCHGEKGEGNRDMVAPYLKGQYGWYLVTQLKNMKANIRQNELMQEILKELNEKDFEHLAAFISKLP